MEKKIFPAIFALMFFASLFSGCILQPPEGGGKIEFKEIKRFKNFGELAAAFREAQQSGRNIGIMDAMKAIPLTAMQYNISGSSAESSAAGVATDYSTTNVQVQGVDEADIVKTDGKFVYSFSKNRLAITDAFPLEGAKIVSKTKLANEGDSEGSVFAQEMFVNDDRLLIFGASSGFFGGGEKRVALPDNYFPQYGGATTVLVYDISDRSNPVLEKTFEFEGNYLTSRMIGKHVYFVVNSFPGIYPLWEKSEEETMPLMRVDGVESRIASADEIGFLPPMPPLSFVTIASIDLDSKGLQKETFAGSAESVFASQNSIFIASRAWLAPDTPVIGPAQGIVFGNEENTIINKFGLEGGKIGFVGQGKVLGHVLNQFSMDEFGGKFRIATTSGQVSRSLDSQSKNNVFVLDGEMKTIGSLEDLAPGEKIYSARFMGNRGYLVTFKKVDPLFVIDLSEPTAPRVLGKLKIPGYSDYLHPIDEGHLIGVGKDTIEANSEGPFEGNFAWYQGLKMAIFDVSDVENPKELHKIIIGDRGTDSYALRDHKAFLYDREKELLVLPVMLAEISQSEKKPLSDERMMPSYGEPVFQGAFVFRVTLENGFEERARITHLSGEDELKRGYYFGDEYSVKRSLFIENVLYTLSDKMLKANDLATMQGLKEFVFD